MGTAIVFGASLASLSLFLFFKQWERQRELLWYQSFRKYGDHATLVAARFLVVVPHKVKFFIVHLLHIIVYHVGALVWRVVRFAERKLYRFVNMIKGRKEVHRERGSSSLFLNAISEGKRQGTTPSSDSE